MRPTPMSPRLKGMLESEYIRSHQVEPEPRRPAPDAALESLEQGISLARACVKQLAKDGYRPTHLEVRQGVMPIVWIEHRVGCARLKREGAGIYKTEGFAGFRMLTWQADRLGCRVQWIEIVMGGQLPC